MTDQRLQNILSIDGNKTVFRDLDRLLGRRQTVAFVGAGASAELYPLWEQLIARLAAFVVESGRMSQTEAERWLNDRPATPQLLVSTFARKLSEPLYHKFLRDTFGPRRNRNGKRYTQVHEALMMLPCRGYVTTNYDPGLDFARSELRPMSLATGTPTWQDDEELHGWLSGDSFLQPDDCPILWMHGYWQRPGSIVLNASEYASAYEPRIYGKVFCRLWEQEHLLFAGFGFSDPAFAFMAGEMIRDIARARSSPRHFAIIGLTSLEGSLSDREYVADLRAHFEEDYFVRPIFYPIHIRPDGREDHLDLLVTLRALSADAHSASLPAQHATQVQRGLVAQDNSSEVDACWIHMTSEDERFIGRQEEFDQLNRWIRDRSVRVIGVCAMGGTGKTALVGHWLKCTSGWKSRSFRGVFAWSFYQERNSALLLSAILDWAKQVYGWNRGGLKRDVAEVERFMQAHAVVVILDGLEVIQGSADTARYGSFLDGDIREFLTKLCTRHHDSVIVLTSRFIFSDLEQHLGTSFHQMELTGLPSLEAAALLHDLDVGGSVVEREGVADALAGHPLGIRIFADAIPASERERPLAFLEYAFRSGHLADHDSLSKKMHRLLEFYEKQLPVEHARLLGFVALFAEPVSRAVLVHLASGLLGVDPQSYDVSLGQQLHWLVARGIMTRERIGGDVGYSCHPVLRDHFRSTLLAQDAGAATRAADLLTNQPASISGNESKRSFNLMIAVIDLLLDAGDIAYADRLYKDRFSNGTLFHTLPAPSDGLRCASLFVRDAERQNTCREVLSPTRLGFYLNETAMFASLVGHFDLAEECYVQGTALDVEMKSTSLSVRFSNRAQLAVHQGRLDHAAGLVAEALAAASSVKDLIGAYACRGWIRTLSGEIKSAASDFAIANAMEQHSDADSCELYSKRGVWWGELLIACDRVQIATVRARKNLRICRANHWNDDAAECLWLSSRCDMADGNPDRAHQQLQTAELLIRAAQMPFDLARLRIAQGHIYVMKRQFSSALAHAAEALALAQSRKMALIQCDALILRGRARLREVIDCSEGVGSSNVGATLARAIDDATDALRVSQRIHYVLGEQHALRLLRDAYDTSASVEPEHAGRFRESSREADEALSCLLTDSQLTDSELELADRNAKVYLADWINRTDDDYEEW